MTKKDKRKPIPTFKTDQDAERFTDTADLSEYDLSNFRPMRFEFEDKSARMNLRLPESQIEALKAEAERRGMPYTRLVREFIALGLQNAHTPR